MSALGRQPGIALFTVAEAAGLVTWLAFARGTVVDPLAAFGVSVSAASIGLGVLFVALVVEHLLTEATLNGPQGDTPVLPTLLVSATETALWAVWLAVAEAVGGLVGVAAAGAILLVLLVPQHTAEDNALRGRGLVATLVDTGTLGFSAVEALGATVWLALVVDGSLLARVETISVLPPALAEAVAGANPQVVGVAALALFLFVEHNLAVRFAGRVLGVGNHLSDDGRVIRV